MILASLLTTSPKTSNTLADVITATSSFTGNIVTTQVSSVVTGRQVTIVGTVALETFSGGLSLSRGLLITGDALYLLFSDPISQTLSFVGKQVRVSGTLQPFSASTEFPGYSCSPFSCNSITNKIVVTTIEELTTTTGTVTTATTATTGPIVPKPLCLIATASFGSQLAPEVRSLRDFRDKTVMANAFGSHFMIAFDSWYYSFSPQSASLLQTNDLARDLMRVLLLPMVASVRTGTAINDLIPLSDYAIATSGLAIAALLGAAYLGPVFLVTGRKRSGMISKESTLLVGASAIILVASNLIGWTVLTEISSVAYVISSVILGAAVTAYGIKRLIYRGDI